MKQSEGPTTPPLPADPLEGYRNVRNDEYEALENEVRAFRALGESEEDLASIGHVLKRNNLLDELAKESSPLRRLAAYTQQVLEDATARWVEVSDPRSQQALDAHGDARAARLVIDWIEDNIAVGNQAEKQLEAD